jgi:multidrug resistance efflux pump
VRRLALLWAAGAGLAALVAARKLRFRRTEPVPTAGPDPRADELRRKLAEARDMAGEREEFEEAETTVDQAEASVDLADRRRAVHERGRAAAEEMRGEE